MAPNMLPRHAPARLLYHQQSRVLRRLPCPRLRRSTTRNEFQKKLHTCTRKGAQVVEKRFAAETNLRYDDWSVRHLICRLYDLGLILSIHIHVVCFPAERGERREERGERERERRIMRCVQVAMECCFY